MYRVEFTSAAARQMRKLSLDVRRRVQARIRELGDEPRPAGATKLVRGKTAWRIRIGDYRVIYDVFDGVLVVTVVVVGHRRDVYRGEKPGGRDRLAALAPAPRGSCSG